LLSVDANAELVTSARNKPTAWVFAAKAAAINAISHPLGRSVVASRNYPLIFDYDSGDPVSCAVSFSPNG
jgi:hypothetical protein